MYKRKVKPKNSVKLNTINNENETDENKSVNRSKSPVMFEEEEEKCIPTNKPNVPIKMDYLTEITRFSGMILHKKNIPNELEEDQGVFIQKVSSYLSKNEGNVARNIALLMDDLKKYCKKYYRLKNALSPTVTAEGKEITRGSHQDCLIRLLLQVDDLYKPIAVFLIEKMAELTATDEGGSEALSWVRMIVQALKYLDNHNSDFKISEKLLDIMLVSSDVQIQIEIINSLPSIVSDDEHSSCALELSKLITNEKLLGVSLEALSQFNFDDNIQLDVQKTLIKSLRRISDDFLPAVIKYLLSTCTLNNVNEVINGLRTDLTFKDVDASTIVIIFKGIQDCMLAVKFLSNSWLKNIANIKNPDSHRPLDCIICLIMYTISTDETKKRSVITLVRNKIRDKMFKKKLIVEALSSFTQVILIYFQSFIRVATLLLKSPDANVVEVAGLMYSGLFEHVEDYYCKLIVNELLVCIGSTGATSALSLSAFKILNKIAFLHPNKMKRLSQILIVLLNKLNELSLQEARQLMDMLSNIAYSDENETSYSSDCEVLKDELNMLVQKQFSSLQTSIVSCGVVGIVMLIKHMATVPESSSYTNDPIDASVEDVELSTYAKKALPMFELLLSNTSRPSYSLGGCSSSSNSIGFSDSTDILRLALDQLSYMITNSVNFDQTLNHHMAAVIRKKLNEMYLVSYSSDSSFSDGQLNLPMNVEFCLNECLKNNEAVNLAPLLFTELENTRKHLSRGKWPISCMNSTLRLLAALEKNDLSEIDILLGCGIVFPQLDVYNPSKFIDLTPFQQHIALNCLFYAINWFFEIINCFTFMIKLRKAKRVLMRLRLVVWLMNQLSLCLPLTLEYIPPLCYFQSVPLKPPAEKKASEKEKSKKKPKKKKKAKKSKKSKDANKNGDASDDEDGEGQEAEEDNDEEDEDNETQKEVERRADLSVYSNYFRELDINVWLFLTQPLTFLPVPIKDGKVTDEMGPSELLFVLDDFVKKLEHKLPSSVKRLTFLKLNANNVTNFCFESLDTLDEEIIVKNTINLLGNLCVYLEKTLDYTRNLIRENDEIYDSPGLFLSGTKEVKQCQNRIFSIFCTLFSWHGFNENSNGKIFNDGLQKMATKLSLNKYKAPNKTTMIRDICKSLSECAPKILYIKTAAVVVNLMKTLSEHADKTDLTIKPLISKVCYQFLCRPWFDFNGTKEQGSVFNKQLNILLLNYINCAEDQLLVLSEVTTSVEEEIKDMSSEKDATLKTFPVFNRNNINWLIDAVLKGIENTIKQKLLSVGVPDKNCFDMWAKIMKYLVSFVSIVRLNDNRTVLRVYVKEMVNILRLIKNHALTTFSYMFKEYHNEVSVTLKDMQSTTRFLQGVCTFTKVTRDATLQNYLPTARSLMESLAFDTRHIFISSNCTEAWYLGSMKHRNVKGDEILTQDANDEEEVESGDENRSGVKRKHSESEDNDNDDQSEKSEMEVDDEDGNKSDDADSSGSNSVSDIC